MLNKKKSHFDSLKKALYQTVLTGMFVVIVSLSGCGGGGGGSSSNPSNNSDTTSSGQTLDPTLGSSIKSGPVTVSAPVGSLVSSIDVNVTQIALPAPLPTGLSQVGDAYDIGISESDQDKIDEPLQVSLQFDTSTISDTNNLLVLHYDNTLKEYQPATILAIDSSKGVVTFESRAFSPFVLVKMVQSLIQNNATPNSFDVTKDGFSIQNLGDSTFSPDGNCIGMAGFAGWYYNYGKKSGAGSNPLQQQFPLSDIEKIIAIRTQLAIENKGIPALSTINLNHDYFGNIVKGELELFGPRVISMYTQNGAGHAVLAIGYNSSSILIYDPNFPDKVSSIPFNGTTIGPYDGGGYHFVSFLLLSYSFLGRTSDFLELAQEANKGFTASNDIKLLSPNTSQTVTGDSTTVSGTVSNLSSHAEMEILNFQNGLSYTIPDLSSGSFLKDGVLLDNGDNPLVLLAGVPADKVKNNSWTSITNTAALIAHVQAKTDSSNPLPTYVQWSIDGVAQPVILLDGNNGQYFQIAENYGANPSYWFSLSSGFEPDQLNSLNISADGTSVLDFGSPVNYPFNVTDGSKIDSSGPSTTGDFSYANMTVQNNKYLAYLSKYGFPATGYALDTGSIVDKNEPQGSVSLKLHFVQVVSNPTLSNITVGETLGTEYAEGKFAFEAADLTASVPSMTTLGVIFGKHYISGSFRFEVGNCYIGNNTTSATIYAACPTGSEQVLK